MTCSSAQEKCYKWHKVNLGNNVTNNQRGCINAIYVEIAPKYWGYHLEAWL